MSEPAAQLPVTRTSPHFMCRQVGLRSLTSAGQRRLVASRQHVMFLARISQWSVTRRLISLTILAAVGPAAIAGMAYRVVSTVKVGGPLYADVVRGKDI